MQNAEKFANSTLAVTGKALSKNNAGFARLRLSSLLTSFALLIILNAFNLTPYFFTPLIFLFPADAYASAGSSAASLTTSSAASSSNLSALPKPLSAKNSSKPSKTVRIDLGTKGNTYPIVEKDMLSQMKKKLAKVNLHKYITKKKMIDAFHRYEHRISTDLPTAHKKKVYTINMKYTLDHNIYDGRGRILYPKGFTYNPLDYITLGKSYVIINADDKRQIKWFMKSKYYQKITSMLMINKGDVINLEKKLTMPVFYVKPIILQRFHIEAVPSVVYQKGDSLYVEEIPINSNH